MTSFAVVFILGFCFVQINGAQTCDSLMLCEIQKIAGSNESFDEFPHFSYSLATTTSGSYMIVGEPGPFNFVQDYEKWVGKAYIYEKKNMLWSKVKTLTSFSSTGMDFFGYSVDISGNYAIIGAYTYDDSNSITDSGSAYIVERNDNTGLWGDLYKLPLAAPIKNDHYGYSVAISSESKYAVVGARYNDEAAGSSSGKVYIYKKNMTNIETEWILEQEIVASDAKSSDKFGSSVAIDNNYIIVGAPEYNYDGNSNVGAGYIFYNDGTMWNEEQILIASDASSSDFVGYSVDVKNGYAILGAPDYDGNGGLTNSGKVYIFENVVNTTWSEQAILVPSDNGFGDKFGKSVGLYSDANKTQAIIGAHINRDLGTNAGAAYLYDLCNDQWTESQKIYGSDTDLDDRFGASVAISEDEVNIGAYRKNGAIGTVYTFDYQVICPTSIPTMSPTEVNDSGSNALSVGYSFMVILICMDITCLLWL